MRCYSATTRMATLLQRCSLHGYVAIALHVAATLRVATMLRRCAWLQRCGTTAYVAAALRVVDNIVALQLTWLQRCDAVALRRCS